jgi:nitrate reductase gamma subunit
MEVGCKMSFMNLPVANQLIDAGSLVVLVLIVLGVFYRYKTGSFHHFVHWQTFNPGSSDGNQEAKSPSSTTVIPSFFTILFREVFAFRVLQTCSKLKRVSHLAIFWGFVFLGISTTLAFFTNPTNLVLPLSNPVKLFGNVGGALVVAGFFGMFSVRYREGAPVLRMTRSDVFLLILFLAVVSGFVTQQTVYSSMGAYWISSAFWIHMVLVIMLLVTAPLTKFFHAISKPVSLLYEEMDKNSGVEPLLPSSTEHVVAKAANTKEE